jgi:hypothetical protein
MFRCPNTDLDVQGRVADDRSEGTSETYETVNCLACRQVHLVNPTTRVVTIYPTLSTPNIGVALPRTPLHHVLGRLQRLLHK